MRLDPHLGMLPERAFNPIGKRMTLEGGGGGGKGGGKGGSQPVQQTIPYGGGMRGVFMDMADQANAANPANRPQQAALAVPPIPDIPKAQPAREADLVEALRARRKLSQSMGNFGGPNSTLLTGPTGVDPNTLALGKTLLTGSNDTLGS
jgi:hypothetical protein